MQVSSQLLHRRSFWSVLLVVSLSRTASTQQPISPADSAQAGEGVALKAAMQLIESRDRLATIWPGFWDATHVFGIFPVRSGTLVLHPRGERWGDDPAVYGLALPAALIGRAAFVPNRVGMAVFDLNFRVGDRVITVVSLIPPFAPYRGTVSESGWLADSTSSLVMFAVHESFHGYQRMYWRPLPDSPVVFAILEPVKPHQAWLDSLWVTEALAIERATLKRAVDALSCAQSSEHVTRYDVLREARLARMPEPFRAYEDAHERAEGIANWVGYEGAHRASTHDTAGVRRTVSDDLAFSYRDGSGQALRGWSAYSSWHLYATGAAKTFVIARCELSDWQARVAKGATLQVLLRLVADTSKD